MSGYTHLASFMAEKDHPILRKYKTLAARDLLFLQAELCHLEWKYKSVLNDDEAQEDERQFHARDWILLESSERRGLGGEQWAIALEIRTKLREYYDAMLKYSHIASLPQPKESERSFIHDWIQDPSLGGGCGFGGRDLGGRKQPSIYEAIYQKDLAMLSDNRGENDLFTRFIAGPLLSCFHFTRTYRMKPNPPNPEAPPTPPNADPETSGFHYYDKNKVETVTNILGTILSSLAPLVSIVVLSYVTKPKARLGLICAFTFLFSTCLAMATRARRVEIFAATAA